MLLAYPFILGETKNSRNIRPAIYVPLASKETTMSVPKLLGAALIAILFAPAAPAQDKTSAGVEVSKQATAKEVGLPVYPGAKPHKEDSDETPATKLGLWGGGFGFKLVVLKLESKDSPEKIAAFYQKALTKYGKVLDCSAANSRPAAKEKKDSSNQLTCEEDQADPGGTLFKAGTKDKQHLVEIKPAVHGLTVFTLLHIATRGTEEKEAL